MEIIGVQEKERWNETVKSFPDWDIYYLNEYAVSLQLHGDGTPFLVCHQDDEKGLCYVVMQEDISEFPALSPYIEQGRYLDWSTPYGYGGPLVKGSVSGEWLKEFQEQLCVWCREHKIVSQFFRFHPLLQNQKIMEDTSDVIYMKKTVYIDTKDSETIFANMTPNNRNMVRKAKKNGIEIVTDQGERIQEFQKIYEATMKKKEAKEYYYFKEDYFHYLIRKLKEHIIFFYAYYQGTPVSASIFFYNENYMHYHLSGTLPEHRKLAATNLLLTEAADWAAARGIRKFHLGGGVEVEDSLLSFKKHFNRNGLLDFCIGRTVFDPEAFDELVSLRKQYDGRFDDTKPFLIKYRG
ncbi:MAG: GNAT family N-acetyltransferase [Eubacterium sp.]|nr:GNAT family N-acetyltransferase [Eubacterium sp.]